MDSFLYCWTDHKTNKLYIGVHKGSFDDGYITSSKYFNEEYNNRPNDFTRQIICNGLFRDLLVLESKILKSIDGKNDPLIYNLHNGDGKFISGPRTKESKNKTSIKTKTYWDSPEGQEKKNRLRERNKIESSIRIKRMWEDGKFKNKPKGGRPKGSKGKFKYPIENKLKPIEYNGVIYKGFENLENETGINSFLYRKFYLNGFNPEIRKGKHGHMKVKEIRQLIIDYCYKTNKIIPLEGSKEEKDVLTLMNKVGIINGKMFEHYLKINESNKL